MEVILARRRRLEEFEKAEAEELEKLKRGVKLLKILWLILLNNICNKFVKSRNISKSILKLF